MERTSDKVKEDTIGGCWHVEARSLVREDKPTLEVNPKGTEDKGKVKWNNQETSAGNIKREERLALSTKPLSQVEKAPQVTIMEEGKPFKF